MIFDPMPEHIGRYHPYRIVTNGKVFALDRWNRVPRTFLQSLNPWHEQKCDWLPVQFCDMEIGPVGRMTWATLQDVERQLSVWFADQGTFREV